MNHLVLHIDEEYIVGTVCVDNGNSFPIKNGDEELLWLYFFNDPHQDLVSFGYGNKRHYRNNEINYYGDFFVELLKDDRSFTLRGIRKRSIDLLDSSGLLRLLKDQYNEITHSTESQIPTLLTFSLSISDLAKQKTVDYLKNHGFTINSYTIPLSELTCYHSFEKQKFIPNNGSISLLLAATNSTLYVMKLVFSGDYFMIDGDYKPYKGMGIDPRTRAVVKYVVNKINLSVGALRNSDEIEDECIKKDIKADEWLKLLYSQNLNRPIRINDSLSSMPYASREVLVRRSDVEKDTGEYVQKLIDILDAFKQDNVSGDVAAVFLLGNCFYNEIVRNKFENRYKNDCKLFFYSNKDIREILSIYPKMPYEKYKDEESRIKELAQAEERKLAEQRELEDKKRKENERIEAERNKKHQLEENRKRAEELYSRALGLESTGKLEDAKVNAENAMDLDKDNPVFKNYYIELCQKIERLNEKNELYKSLLKDGEKLISNGNFDDAITKYEAAKEIFDNAEIAKLIIDAKAKNNKSKKLYSDASRLYKSKDFQLAKEQISEFIKLCPNDKVGRALHDKIDESLRIVEIKNITDEINKLIDCDKLDEAEVKIGDLRTIDVKNSFATEASKKISKIRKDKKEKIEAEKNLKKIACFISEGDRLFEIESYDEAVASYQKALLIDKRNTDAKVKIDKCNEKIRLNKLECQIKDLTEKCKDAVDNKNYKEAKDLYLTLSEIDKVNSGRHNEAANRMEYLCSLSSQRFVKGEIADIKAALRNGKNEYGKRKIAKLKDDLHYIDCYNYDDELNEIAGYIEPQVKHRKEKEPASNRTEKGEPSNISKQQISVRDLRMILAGPKAKIRNGNYMEANVEINELESKYIFDSNCQTLLNDVKKQIPNVNVKGTVITEKIKNDNCGDDLTKLVYGTITTLSEREIIIAKREIRALMSMKKNKEALDCLKTTIKKISKIDFEKYEFDKLLEKIDSK